MIQILQLASIHLCIKSSVVFQPNPSIGKSICKTSCKSLKHFTRVILPESLSISLSLEYGAHEQLQGASVQLSPADLTLARGLPVQAEHLPQLLLPGSTRPINFVAEDQDRAGSQLLVSQ